MFVQLGYWLSFLGTVIVQNLNLLEMETGDALLTEAGDEILWE